ncbi:DUF5683 domain-containing protein [Ichthyobacterium seriolicida]|uniref:DUF5683 domain-containing protein n=1 Tax=Ichthyobacterium seriolicida TaxID=242600 RepID=A0A1J1E035_9FLAO|nr:DUF5683 domain-containing protein [Ichthyobacterium seriolicida]BAV94293.1 hypothetical protein JBKA6_0280 [Ichthyobacterium seriolicida]
MKLKKIHLLIILIFPIYSCFAQIDELDNDKESDDKIEQNSNENSVDQIESNNIESSAVELKDSDYQIKKLLNTVYKSPSKATFYSSVLPGLGQVYNEDYWKIPVIYAAMSLCAYYGVIYDLKYEQFRKAYFIRQKGEKDEFYDTYSNENTLLRGQDIYLRLRNVSLIVLTGVYVLNIIDALVYAHLYSFNTDIALSIKPNLILDRNDIHSVGLKIAYDF